MADDEPLARSWDAAEDRVSVSPPVSKLRNMARRGHSPGASSVDEPKVATLMRFLAVGAIVTAPSLVDCLHRFQPVRDRRGRAPCMAAVRSLEVVL